MTNTNAPALAAWEAVRALIVRDLLAPDDFDQVYAPMRGFIPEPGLTASSVAANDQVARTDWRC